MVLCTQVANDRSLRLAGRLGFTEAARFEEYGAEQWFGVRAPGGSVLASRRGDGDTEADHRESADASDQ